MHKVGTFQAQNKGITGRVKENAQQTGRSIQGIFCEMKCSFCYSISLSKYIQNIPGIASIIKALHADNTCHSTLGIISVHT